VHRRSLHSLQRSRRVTSSSLASHPQTLASDFGTVRRSWLQASHFKIRSYCPNSSESFSTLKSRRIYRLCESSQSAVYPVPGRRDYCINAGMQGADNNYAPPKAAVADVQPEDVVNKPPAVVGALILLWIFAGMTAVGSLILSFEKKPSGPVTSLITFAVIALLAVCIGRRSRTARVVLLVLAVVVLLGGGITVVEIAQAHGRQPIGQIVASVWSGPHLNRT
jgi:hypothetical protein